MWITKKQYKELKSFEGMYRALEKQHERLLDNHEAEIRKIERNHVQEREELSALRELKMDSLRLQKREIALEASEALLKAKNDEFDTITKELAKASEKAEKAREEGKKTGYADGVADGLREATKITGEDRKMMGQIAALAASSHQGDASTKIADAIAKDIHNALPATTKK